MAKKSYFDEVDLKVDFPAREREILAFWYKEGIVQKYLAKNKASKKRFSFLDGPITANNPMGVHHAWGRTYKDLWQRFKNMQGYRQRFQNGFDCQGLWVEVEVEKELGLKSKKDIENLVPGDKKASIAAFVELCKARVEKYAKIQTEQSKRLGYFMDWENSYYTLSDANNYMIWYFLEKCAESGLIYKGTDSVPWCPRCGTAISQHEILTEDYKEIAHETIFFKLPVKDKDFKFLVWTTTPWTIPANVALAVNPTFKYIIWGKAEEKLVTVDPAEIQDPESKAWFAKHIKTEELKNLKTMAGKELLGLVYEGPFDNLERVRAAQKEKPKTFHRVIAAEDLVVATKGTGILHVAPGAGEEDFQLGKKEDLPVIEVIDEEANYYWGMGELSTKNAKKHPEIIIDFLRAKDGGKYLLKTTPITHRYPACWRCKTELVWRVVDEWYIAMDKPLHEKTKKLKNGKTLRNQMMAVAKKINWIPEFGLERELDWLANMHDWLISKKRYWGLALPIWECKNCGFFEVIGGKEDLRKKAVSGWEAFNGQTPHRPWIDEVKIKCAKCGQLAERIPDVGNPWLDAGIVSFSTITIDNQGEPLYWRDRGEWAKWYPADFITESFPGQFKNWFYSLIAESTVLEGTEPFKTVLGFATLLGEDGRPMHKSWGNAIEFNEGADKIGVDVMRWMYVRQNPQENLLFGYKLADETRRRFHLKLWNIYNFFVTYANSDAWRPDNKLQVASNKLEPMDRWILSRLNQTIGGVTKYLDEYNAYSASGLIEEFVDDLSNWYIRRSRKRVGPAADDEKEKGIFYETAYSVLVTLAKLLAPFLPFISEDIFRNLTKGDSVHLAEWPIAGKVNYGLVADMADIREIVEDGHAQRKAAKIPVRIPLRLLTTKLPKTLKTKGLDVYLKEELNVKNWKMVKGKQMKNQLDTKITPELEEEAKVRELIRKIQEERKRLGLELTQKIMVVSPWLPSKDEFTQTLKKVTLADELQKGHFKIKKIS